MSDSSISDQQIVHALSIIEVPDEVLRRIDLKGIVNVVDTASRDVQKHTADLDRARNELKEGWWIVNVWNKREEKVEDLQYNLQKSVGNLTDKTAQLLIFNTAISRELNKQQHTLLDQQVLLKQQTLALEKQNSEIFEQQKILEFQQQEINAANQGLLEAKGVTAEQARKLIGCVVRVESAEEKFHETNQRLLEEVTEKLQQITIFVSVTLTEHDTKWTETVAGISEQVVNKFREAKEESLLFYSKTSEDMTAFSGEIHRQVNEHISSTGKAILESANSMQNALDSMSAALSASIQEKHFSMNNAMEVLARAQTAERTRLEEAFEAKVVSIRDDFGRRSKILFIAVVVFSCMTLAIAGVQIISVIRH